MRKILTIIITILILLGFTFGLTYFIEAKFIDYAFFVGLIVTIVIWFFSSKGGFSSRNLDISIQATTGMKQENHKYEFAPNIPFLTALVYTVISLISSLIYYNL